MKLTRLTVRNFRGLQNVTLNSEAGINVLVGPNAIGKSTLLTAVRLVKTVLAPRISNEGNQTLMEIGVLSPSNPVIGSPGTDIAAAANVVTQPIEIALSLTVDEREINTFKSAENDLALLLYESELSSSGNNVLNFAQLLSSPSGRSRLSAHLGAVRERVTSMTANATLDLQLVLDPTTRMIRGSDALTHAFIAIIDRRLPVYKTLFNTFPADRTFPQGDQPIQLGPHDAQQQLQSHMGQPSLKFARIKQAIIQSVLLQAYGPTKLKDEFNLIFDALLPSKRLEGVAFGTSGQLKVIVSDTQTGKSFDIDQMSSGEKGLALTFLFLRLSMEAGGIALIDEPELHLNSAVQANIYPFIKEHCVKALGIQAFIATHSPEITRAAFDDDDARLFHLRSGKDLTPVLQRDQKELFEIFDRLGSSPADVLFTSGNIYVEGVDDVQIIKAGFPERLAGWEVSSVGGRSQIERDVPLLQAEERAGRLNKQQLFIMDNDRNATTLRSSARVRVEQLQRYSIENYLLNEEYPFDLISDHARKDVESRGMFPAALEELALSQVTELAAQEVYSQSQPDSPGMRTEDIKGKTLNEIAETMARRLDRVSDQLQGFDQIVWANEFLSKGESKKAQLLEEWKGNWRALASGKRLIDDVYVKYEISMKKIEFKKLIIKRMSTNKTDDWRVLDQIISANQS